MITVRFRGEIVWWNGDSGGNFETEPQSFQNSAEAILSAVRFTLNQLTHGINFSGSKFFWDGIWDDMISEHAAPELAVKGDPGAGEFFVITGVEILEDAQH